MGIYILKLKSTKVIPHQVAMHQLAHTSIGIHLTAKKILRGKVFTQTIPKHI